MAIERDFKGIWIPKEIWLDSNLTWSEKMLLVEIDSLATLEKGCIATNEYLSDFFNLLYFIKVGILTAKTIIAIRINNKAKVSSVDPWGEDKIFKIAKEINAITTKNLKVNIFLK